jgi:hypothetical protein
MLRTRSHRQSALLTLTGLCAAVCLAGCGGASSVSSSAHAARSTPLQSSADVGQAPVQSATRSRAPQRHRAIHGRTAQTVSRGPAPRRSAAKRAASSHQASTVAVFPPPAAPQPKSGARVQAHPTPATSSDGNRPVVTPAENPCRLVSLSEAETMTGGTVTRMTAAPLGPTCIYNVRSSKAPVTVALEPVSFPQVTRPMKVRNAVVVHGRHAVCGRLGAAMLFVQVGPGETLNVTAPCTVAQRFAATALTHLGA